MMKIKNEDRLFFRLSIILLVASLIYTVFAILSGIIPEDFYFNTDSLYRASLFHSLFVDHESIRLWKLPDASFMFPDFALHALFQTIFSNYKLSVLLTSVTLYFLILFSIYKVFICLLPKNKIKEKTVFVLGLTLFNLLISGRGFILLAYNLLKPSHHKGEIFIAIWLLYLCIATFRKEKFSRYVLYFLLLTLIVFSDMSIMKDFLAPLFTALAVLYFFDKYYLKQIMRIVGISIVSYFVGSNLTRLITSFNRKINFVSTLYQENVRFLVSDFISFFTSKHILFMEIESLNFMWIIISLAIFSVVLMGTFIINERNALRSGGQFEKQMFIFLTIFILSQVCFSIAATIFFGYYRGYTHLRYFVMSFILPNVWLIFYLGSKIKGKTIKKVIISGSVIISFLQIFKFSQINNVRAYLEYKPPYTDCVGSISKEYGLQNGIADFWYTSPIMLELDYSVRLHQFTPHNDYLVPFHWVSTVEWYKKTPYQFVINKNFDDVSIIKTFGEPIDKISCEDILIYIYDPASVSNGYLNEFEARVFFANFIGKDNIAEIEGKDFNTYVFDRAMIVPKDVEVNYNDDGSISSGSTAGIIAQGPALGLQKGKYRFTLEYSTTSEDSGVISLTVYPEILERLYNLPSTNGQVQEYSFDVEVGKDASTLKSYNFYNAGVVRLAAGFTGKGELILRKVAVEKLD